MFLQLNKKPPRELPELVPGVFTAIMNGSHSLIAGTTGSGKSVYLNGFMQCLIYRNGNQFVLIDPKKVELSEYKRLPQTIAYARTTAETVNALNGVVKIMDKRYKAMERKGLKKSTDSVIWVVIDELADLMTTAKKQVEPLLIRIAQLGRAANIRLVMATQRPTADVINKRITVNIDNRIALRTQTAQDSRNILYSAGAETLPRYGLCFLLTPELMQPIKTTVPIYAPYS